MTMTKRYRLKLAPNQCNQPYFHGGIETGEHAICSGELCRRFALGEGDPPADIVAEFHDHQVPNSLRIQASDNGSAALVGESQEHTPTYCWLDDVLATFRGRPAWLRVMV
jgi:hypothetical protein